MEVLNECIDTSIIDEKIAEESRPGAIDYDGASAKMKELRGLVNSYTTSLKNMKNSGQEYDLLRDWFKSESKKIGLDVTVVADYTEKTNPQAELDRLINLYTAALKGGECIRDVAGHISWCKEFSAIDNYTGEMLYMLNDIIELLGYTRY
jgi:hypothetical protein